jgi:hypothetical protein
MGDQVLVYKNVLAKKSYGSVGCGWAFIGAPSSENVDFVVIQTHLPFCF